MTKPESEVAKDVDFGEVIDTPFENILNFRDVGKTVNQFLGQKYAVRATRPSKIQALTTCTCLRRVAEGKIFRSARPGGSHSGLAQFT